MRSIFLSACAGALLLGGTLIAQNSNNNNANNANKAASQASREVKQDTKTTTNSGTSSVSTDTFYGKVESYDLNKNMSVSEPGNSASNKSFDLAASNQTVHVAPGVKVGDWVKVEQKTDNNGHKTLTISRSSEKASRAKRNQTTK